jgi:hypothetical protein
MVRTAAVPTPLLKQVAVARARTLPLLPEEVAVDKTDVAALLALGAALFIAIGDVIHQRSAHEVTDETVGNMGLFTRLLRDTRWWLGTLVAAVGFALQAAALGLGSVLPRR